MRTRMATAVQKMKKFMEEMSETNRTLERILGEIKGGSEGCDGGRGQQDNAGEEEGGGGPGAPGTAESARRRVRAYFQVSLLKFTAIHYKKSLPIGIHNMGPFTHLISYCCGM